jgi:hypothetical protein
MEIKRIIFEQLLLEKRIGQISANITISLDLHQTGHSSNQRFRHKDTGGPIITNSDITNLVERAKNDISFHIVQGAIEDGKDFVITDETGEKGISLALTVEEISPYQWNLIIRTVFSAHSGEPFRVGRDQLQIKI